MERQDHHQARRAQKRSPARHGPEPGPCRGSRRRSAGAGSGSVLVAFFTRTGNTAVIARQIRRALDADLFEIRPAEAYPEDYEETVAQATRERESGFEPPLATLVPNVERYETVFLGFPIWGMSAPPVIRSFLSQARSLGKDPRPLHHAWRLWPWAEPQRGRRAGTTGAASRGLLHGGRSGAAHARAGHKLARRGSDHQVGRRHLPRLRNRARSISAAS